MAISLKDWQKNKAKTLLREPLSDELRKHDAAAAAFLKSRPMSLEAMRTYSGVLKSLQVTIQKTIGLCLPKVHDGTKKYLQNLEKDVKGLYGELQNMQKTYSQTIISFKPKRAEAIAAMEAVLKTSTPKAVQDAKAKTDALLTFLNELLRRGYTSNEITSGMAAMTKVLPAYDQILKKNADRAPATGRALPLTPADLSGELNDIRVALKQAKSIGGYEPPKSVLDRTKAIVF